jgi:hypothetical protein
VSKTLLIAGLSLTLFGALVLAWRDLIAKSPTWNSMGTEWHSRKRLALFGFPMIGVGTILQIVGVALS